MLDGNRAHFLPYVAMRVPMEMDLKIEDFTVNGNGTAPNPTGFLNETGVLKLPNVTNKITNGQIVATASDIEVLDFILDAVVKVHVDTKGLDYPNVIILHPSDYARFLKIKDDQNQYQLIFNEVNTPTGANLTTLWGVPIVQSLAINAKTMIVMNTRHTSIYYLAHQPNRLREGYVADNMLKNIRTSVIDTYMNQYTVRPQAILQISQA